MKNKLFFSLASFILLAAMLACGTSPAGQSSTPRPTITPTQPPPTPTKPPLYLTVTLASTPFTDSSKKPLYTVKAQIPQMQGSTDPRVVQFNNEMTGLTQEEIAKFKDNARMASPIAGSAGSTYQQSFKLVSEPGNLYSVKFFIDNYIDGAAHPTSYSRSITYDLEAGVDISLDELFVHGSTYLNTIADYCIGQLKARNIGFESFASGAAPTAENYGTWNITTDGLLITFDEYQVAAYAAGPQTVVVPYSVLKPIIDNRGPISKYIP